MSNSSHWSLCLTENKREGYDEPKFISGRCVSSLRIGRQGWGSGTGVFLSFFPVLPLHDTEHNLSRSYRETACATPASPLDCELWGKIYFICFAATVAPNQDTWWVWSLCSSDVQNVMLFF